MMQLYFVTSSVSWVKKYERMDLLKKVTDSHYSPKLEGIDKGIKITIDISLGYKYREKVL